MVLTVRSCGLKEDRSSTPIFRIGSSQIIKDLKQAEQLLPERYTAGQAGRATKGAAAALLGKVLLAVGRDEQAKAVLRSIVDEYDYRLLDDYGDLWGPGDELMYQPIKPR